MKFNISDFLYVICNDFFYGLWFGKSDLVISDMVVYNINFSSCFGEFYNLLDDFVFGSVDVYNYLVGSRYFMFEEVEVFYIGKN